MEGASSWRYWERRELERAGDESDFAASLLRFSNRLSKDETGFCARYEHQPTKTEHIRYTALTIDVVSAPSAEPWTVMMAQAGARQMDCRAELSRVCRHTLSEVVGLRRCHVLREVSDDQTRNARISSEGNTEVLIGLS